MRRRGRLLLLFGIILAVIAGGVTFVLLQQPPEVVEAPPTTKKVVFAVEDIAAGKPIDPAIAELRDWPIDSSPPDALTNVADLSGKYAKSDIYAGQIIQSRMLATGRQLAETGELASALVPEGMVAYPFPISELSGVAYALTSGDHVDVLVTFRFLDVDRASQVVLPLIRGEEGEIQGVQVPRLTSQLTLQNIEVLKVGSWYTPPPVTEQRTSSQQAAPTPAPPGVITLLVSQQDALVLQYARQVRATVEFALRNPNDETLVTTEPVTLDYILSRFNVTVPTRRDQSLQTLLSE